MELRHTESLSVLDSDHSCVGNIDADFYDCRGYQYIGFPAAKSLHDLSFLRGLHAPVKRVDLYFRRKDLLQLLSIIPDVLQFAHFPFFHFRAYHVGLPSLFDLSVHEAVDPAALIAADRQVFDRKSSCRHLIEHGDLQIPVHNNCKCPGDRSCAHDQYRYRRSLPGKALSLPYPETVLFIRYYKSKIRVFNAVLDQSVSSDDDIRSSGRDLIISRFSRFSLN